MEQLVLGIFQEQLAKFLVGFKKEQVNANLLNGKGQIRDVNINCSFINDQLCKLTPHIMLESIRVSKLGFNVTSWTNLKKAPILVDVEDVYVTIMEPLTYTDEDKRLSFKQLSWAEYKELIKDTKNRRGQYNLLDRILDNLQIEIRSVNIIFQPRGRFKTYRVGPWSPPALHVQLRHLKYCSVDEFGNEATPEDCWRHNKFEGYPRDQTLLIYKKASMQVTMGFQKPGEDTAELPPLMKDVQVQVHLAFHKKFYDGSILAIQMDVTLNQVELNLDRDSIPVLAHGMAGMQYCFTKDRAFDDPLLPRGGGEIIDGNIEVAAPHALLMGTPTSSNEEAEESNDDEDASQENIEESLLDEGIQDMILEEGSIDGVEDGSVDTDDNDEEEETENDTGKPQDLAPDSNTAISSAPDKSNAKKRKSEDRPVKPKKRKSKDRPVIILPSGLVIHRALSVSLSVQDCKVRGNYGGYNDGYIQLQAKGLVAEMIWPKVTREKGGYLQMSLAYLTVQEKYLSKLTTIVRGGVHRDTRSGPIETPARPRPEIPRDENFPLFENRSVRPDPLDLRHSFPAQAIGMKATVNFIDKVSHPEQEEILVLNEIGVDQLEVIFDSESWCRALRFAMNETGGGFDPRWHSGDWSNVLTTDMLVHPSQPFILSDHLQMTKQMFLDENDMLSSDLFNMTARLSNTTLKVPAAIQRDIRSCDIVIQLDEMMLVISSALPRTFLSGKIGSSIKGEGSMKDATIDFPNDPSDICYALDLMEDPLIRQQGTQTSRRVSTFRAQLTIRGLVVRMLPVIPFYDAVAPRDLLAPLEMTMLLCFEGEPSESPDSDLIKIVVFQSMQIHNLEINCDFDMITGAVSSILYHFEIVSEAVAAVKKLPGFEPAFPVDETVASGIGNDSNKRIRSTIGGRKVLAKQQIERSRETGGFSIELCVQVARVGLHIWRQNVPMNSRFRASISGDRAKIDESPIPLVQLLSVTVQDIELGMEAVIQQAQRRIVLKSCISQLQIKACDFDKASSRHLQVLDAENSGSDMDQKTASREEGNENGSPENDHEETPGTVNDCNEEIHDDMVCIVSIGGERGKDIMVRLEDHSEQQRSVSISADMDVGGVLSLHIHEIEIFFLLVVEALLLPTEVKPPIVGVDGVVSIQFPEGSIGALFVNLARLSQKAERSPRVDVKRFTAESNSLDHLLHTLLFSMLPENISELLVRFSVGDLLLFVPHHSNSSSGGPETAPWLGLELREASLVSAYIGSNSSNDGLVQRLGQKGSTWASLIPHQHSGFHHIIKTSQGLHSAELIDSQVVLKNALIDTFDIGLTQGPENIDLSMGDSTLSLQDLSNVRRLYSSLVAFVQRFKLMQHRIESVTSALARKWVEEDHVPNVKEAQINTYTSDTSEIVDEAETSLQRGRSVLERLKHVLEMHDANTRATIRRKQEEIDRLRVQVFLKEKSRVAALALVSCQTAGWLRLGGMHMTGERSPTTASMWRYHAVLRKSLLIVYAGPGQPRPLDVVNLKGASLLTLAGGHRKRDTKNGFAIRERTGCIRYVLAPNGPELEVWLRELQKAIKTYSRDELQEDDDMTTDLAEVSEDDSEGRIRARTLSSDIGSFDSFDEGSAHGVVGKPKRSQKIKERLSKVTASTRSSLGTSVQVAKQRGQKGSSEDADEAESIVFHEGNEVANSTNLATTNLESAATSEILLKNVDQVPSDPDSLTNSVADYNLFPQTLSFTSLNELNSVDAQEGLNEDSAGIPTERPKGQMFGKLRSNTKSKLGSALQVAREKALAVAEERRRRQEERESNERSADSIFVKRGLRVRLENAAASVKSKIEQGEATSPPREANSELTHPVVVEDPLLNQGTDNHTSGNTTIAESSKGIEETDQLVGDRFEDAAEIETNRPVAGSQLRNRLTKIGAAVKKVTKGNQSAKGPAATPGELGSPSPSRFSIRRNRQQGAPLPEENDLLKLKAIRIAGRVDANDSNGEDGVSILAKIKGGWMVHVQSQDPASSKVALLEESTEESNTDVSKEKPRLENEVVEPVTEFVVAYTEGTMVPKHEDVEEKKEEGDQYRYCVRILSQDPLSQKKIKVSTLDRSFQDVLGLFIDVLECVSAVPEKAPSNSVDDARDPAKDMKEDLAHSLGIAPIDIVKLTGELLGGLLSASSSFHSIAAYHEYQCEVLTEFLNAALTCSMPIRGCMAVLDFLEIIDAGIVPVDVNGDDAVAEITTPSIQQHAPNQNEPVDRANEIMSLTAACLTHLLRAEASGILAQKLGEPKESPSKKPPTFRRSASMPTTAPFLEPLLPASVSNGLRDAMHDALTSVMTERDEAHAQLIATSILHVHEVESERRQVELARKKLQVAAAQAKRQQGGLFADRFNDHKSRDAKCMQNYLENLVKSSDTEINGLCKQLAKEVSDKTVANLEIYRLKESLKIERDTDTAEKQALAEELRKVREQLVEANKKVRANEEETQRLKEPFENHGNSD